MTQKGFGKNVNRKNNTSSPHLHNFWHHHL